MFLNFCFLRKVLILSIVALVTLGSALDTEEDRVKCTGRWDMQEDPVLPCSRRGCRVPVPYWDTEEDPIIWKPTPYSRRWDMEDEHIADDHTVQDPILGWSNRWGNRWSGRRWY